MIYVNIPVYMIKSLIIMLVSMLPAPAHQGNESARIASAIQSANTAELVAMFNTSIELVTPTSSGVSTREQARIVLDNFFRNNPPVRASVTHETSGTTNSMIVISLQTKTGNFRVSVSGCNKGSGFVINEFKIS